MVKLHGLNQQTQTRVNELFILCGAIIPFSGLPQTCGLRGLVWKNKILARQVHFHPSLLFDTGRRAMKLNAFFPSLS